LVAATRERESELEALCVDAPADPNGRWNAKDHLAHLTAWRNRGADLLDAVRTGGVPPEKADEDDAENAKIYAATRDKRVEQIKREAHASWERLAASIEAYSEADLMKPHPHSPGNAIWENVPGIAGHLGTHLMWWYLETSDPAAAEAVQLWARDVEHAATSNPKERAITTYNLACLYSRIGKIEKALPLLRESFDGNPDLREWAGKDPDLDPIRANLEFGKLLLMN
jgi:tetratricopeptide (TPR) repeat protein